MYANTSDYFFNFYRSIANVYTIFDEISQNDKKSKNVIKGKRPIATRATGNEKTNGGRNALKPTILRLNEKCTNIPLENKGCFFILV
ncbi:hypothetical protein TEPIDINF_000224 [Tepidibacillus infernus]|uniref:hypothetical protein n=1 Tax=Tepidibacillus infernus TaxID=1806172 RepID=UPI003B70C588